MQKARRQAQSSGLFRLEGGDLEAEWRRCGGDALRLRERERLLRGLSERLFLRGGVLDADRERERDLERERERESEVERRDLERDRERDLERDRFDARLFLDSYSLIRRPLRSVLSSLERAFRMSA